MTLHTVIQLTFVCVASYMCKYIRVQAYMCAFICLGHLQCDVKLYVHIPSFQRWDCSLLVFLRGRPREGYVYTYMYMCSDFMFAFYFLPLG